MIDMNLTHTHTTHCKHFILNRCLHTFVPLAATKNPRHIGSGAEFHGERLLEIYKQKQFHRTFRSMNSYTYNMLSEFGTALI